MQVNSYVESFGYDDEEYQKLMEAVDYAVDPDGFGRYYDDCDNEDDEADCNDDD